MTTISSEGLTLRKTGKQEKARNNDESAFFMVSRGSKGLQSKTEASLTGSSLKLVKSENHYSSSSGFNEVEGSLENVGLCIQKSEELETRTRRAKWPLDRVVLG